jgi:hypothetical protein
MKTGQLKLNDVIEVIIHPDFDGKQYLDNTNFDVERNIYPLEDTNNKLNGFNKIDYSEACLIKKTRYGRSQIC